MYQGYGPQTSLSGFHNGPEPNFDRSIVGGSQRYSNMGNSNMTYGRNVYPNDYSFGGMQNRMGGYPGYNYGLQYPMNFRRASAGPLANPYMQMNSYAVTG